MSCRSRLYEIAERLEIAGFNIIPIGDDKKPLGSWSSSERKYTAYDIYVFGDKVKAIAITGDYYATGDYATLILDIDSEEADAILNKVFDNWKQELCGTHDSFCGFTGPRPKHVMKCKDDICINEETGEKIPVSKIKRGYYVVIRASRECIPSSFKTIRAGSVELIYSNYQIVYGIHPSGLCYEFVKWDGDWIKREWPGPGVIIDCTQLRNLLTVMNYRNNDNITIISICKETKPIADPERLLDTLKTLWKAERGGSGHYHDELLYALISVAYRRCIDGNSLKEVLNKLFKWAKAVGLDNDKTIQEHWTQTFNYIYGGKARKLWGISKLRDAVNNAAQALGMDETIVEPIIDDIIKSLGVDIQDEYKKPLCVPIKTKETITKNIHKKEIVSKICNTPRGIVKVDRNIKKGQEGNETIYTIFKLVNAFINELTIYKDVELDIEYIDAKIEIPGGGGEEIVKMSRNALERIMRKRVVVVSPHWFALLDYFPKRIDYIISGFVCPPPDQVDRYPCGVRDYFNTGVINSANKNEAKEAIESLLGLFSKYAPTENWYRDAVSAFFHGAFQNFFFTRKLWNVRPQIIAFVGAKGTGKTTIARLLLHAFFPRVVNKLFHGAASVLTPARIGRIQSDVVATLIVLDEVERVPEKQDVYVTLKSYISNPIAWRTATGDEWPARAGLILTANAFTVEDPELADKIYTILFRDTPSLETRTMFAKDLLSIINKIHKFGAYYLKYAEDHWQEIKDYVLHPDASIGAEIYAKAIANDLGISLEMSKPVQSVLTVMSATDVYVKWLYSYIVRFVGSIRNTDTPAAWILVETAIERMLLPHHRITDNKNVFIMRSIQGELGISISTLCGELGGSIVTDNQVFSLDGMVYGACVVNIDKILSLLAEIKIN